MVEMAVGSTVCTVGCFFEETVCAITYVNLGWMSVVACVVPDWYGVPSPLWTWSSGDSGVVDVLSVFVPVWWSDSVWSADVGSGVDSG